MLSSAPQCGTCDLRSCKLVFLHGIFAKIYNAQRRQFLLLHLPKFAMSAAVRNPKQQLLSGASLNAAESGQ